MASTPEILQHFANTYTLGEDSMDHTHREFLELCLATSQARGEAFGHTFQRLFQHTQAHFADEEARMQASRFPAYQEHRADHQRILGDMDRFCQRALAGRATMARAWLDDSLPTWFDNHARTMDSALAAHLNQQH